MSNNCTIFLSQFWTKTLFFSPFLPHLPLPVVIKPLFFPYHNTCPVNKILLYTTSLPNFTVSMNVKFIFNRLFCPHF